MEEEKRGRGRQEQRRAGEALEDECAGKSTQRPWEAVHCSVHALRCRRVEVWVGRMQRALLRGGNWQVRGAAGMRTT